MTESKVSQESLPAPRHTPIRRLRNASRQPLLKLWRMLPESKWLYIRLLWWLVHKFLVGVAGVVLNEAGEVLLLKHTYRKTYPWGLPGGWLKRGEQPAAALQREITEETGLQVRVLHPLLAYSDSDGEPWMNLIFLCQFEGGEFRPSAEVCAAQFYSLSELPVLLPEQVRVLKEAL